MEENKGHGSDSHGSNGEQCMWDLLMVVITIGFFAVALAYIKACGKLR
jgi:hypothetical protein